MNSIKKLTVGNNFLGRVFYTSIYVSVILTLFTLSFDDDRSVTSGFIVGSIIGLVFFRVIWWTIDRLFLMEHKKRFFFAAKVTLVKFPLTGVVLYYGFKNHHINPFALVGGLILVHVVMFLKVIGNLMINHISSSTVFRKGRGK